MICLSCKRERGPGDEGKCGALLHPVWADQCGERYTRRLEARIAELESSHLAVTALDEWVSKGRGQSWGMCRAEGFWRVLLTENFLGATIPRIIPGDSPEAARANAAEAVRTDGPESEPMTSAERAVRPTEGSD